MGAEKNEASSSLFSQKENTTSASTNAQPSQYGSVQDALNDLVSKTNTLKDFHSGIGARMKANEYKEVTAAEPEKKEEQAHSEMLAAKSKGEKKEDKKEEKEDKPKKSNAETAREALDTLAKKTQELKDLGASLNVKFGDDKKEENKKEEENNKKEEETKKEEENKKQEVQKKDEKNHLQRAKK